MGNSASTDEFILACQSNDLVKMKKQIKLKIDVNSDTVGDTNTKKVNQLDARFAEYEH